MILCEYGCNQEANFQLKVGKWCCSKYPASCPIIRKKNSDKNIGNKSAIGNIPWNKNKTKKEDDRIACNGEILKQKYALGELKHIPKKHTQEAKNKISIAKKKLYASGWEPICGRCKKYNYNSPIAGDIKVDGTWELLYCNYLDSVQVNWKRNKNRFSYINLEGKKSTYQPDFWIEDWNTYVEVKGYETDLDRCKWSQFNEPLKIIRKSDIENIRKGSLIGKAASC